MTYYEELLGYLKSEDREKAGFLEEEINIMIHKLKFLPTESFPGVIILSQKNNFKAVTSESLREKVTLAGRETFDRHTRKSKYRRHSAAR